MKKICFLIVPVLLLIVLNACLPFHKSSFSFERLWVEYAEEPINIDESHPCFFWVVSSESRDEGQTAWQLLVATRKEMLNEQDCDAWNSGKQISSETIQHEYVPDNLKLNQKYYWKVLVWDRKGKKHESPISTFETAFLNKNCWKAVWIGEKTATESLPAKGFYGNRKEQYLMRDTVVHSGKSLLLRTEIRLTKTIRKAKAFITGVGFYEFYMNGNRVGNHVLAPAKTPYHKYILYDTYDVTKYLQGGENALGIHLGNGWYNPYKKWWNQYRMQWFGHKKAIARICVTYIDGTEEVFTTDENWKYAEGPVIFSCIYDGEVYDASREQPGWNATGFDDSAWNKVKVYPLPEVQLKSHVMPAIKVNETITPKEISLTDKYIHVYDMGQNFTGWVRLKMKGKRNTRVIIRFAEDIHEDGTIDVSSNEHARATAKYIMKGDGWETYEPSFSYFGFRYVQVSSEDGPVQLADVEGRVVHTANTPAGQFDCSNELVSKIHHATVWSQKSNMIGYPMDCPQRDERLGWLGDAQVTAEEAMFNFNMALFYRNWLKGIQENQDEKTGDIPIISPQPYFWDEGIEWSSTYFTLLWQYYMYYGDKRILSGHYANMKRYMAFLDSIADNRILPKGWIGDWGSLAEGWKEGLPESVPTAFYYYDATILSQVAAVLGNQHDQQYFTRLANNIKQAYNQTYLNTETGNYNDGSQMANAFPLFLGIVPPEVKQKVLDQLVNDIVVTHGNHLTTGVLGTKYMPEALAQSGRPDIAWDIINQKTYPGWYNMMKKYTTTCEFWTLKQSKNHVMMGSIDAWFYKYITGIQLDESHPAFSSFSIKPLVVDKLDHARAVFETIRGQVVSGWKKESGKLIFEIEIPFNTSATIELPGPSDAQILEGSETLDKTDGVDYLGYSDGKHQVKVQSGKYLFTIE